MNKYIYLVFLLFCSLWSSAQNLSFNLPFITENAESEIFFLDPNYDKDYNVDYYSFGDLLKIKYEHDSQQRPMKKVLYVMDKYDREWEQMMVTDYEYNKDGKLTCEKATQYYGKTPLYQLSQIRTYGTNNTDTTRANIEWLETKYQGHLNVPVQKGYTIRYLNQHNLPDSTLHIVNEDWFSYSLKQYYTYNKNKELKYCEAFRIFENEEGKTEQVKIYSYEIKRNKHGIEYIQTSTVPDMEDNEDYEYYRGVNDYKTKEEITRYIITIDKSNRILSKELISDNKTILNSKYSYSSTGQTNVDMKLSLAENFMQSYGFSGMSGTLKGLARELEDISYSVVNKENSRHTTFYMKDKKAEIISLFYPDSRLQSIEMIRYDDGELDDHDKDEYKYLENGLVEKITYRHSYEGPGMDPYRKYLYRQDDKGRTIYIEEHAYDEKEKQWTAREKKIYGFDQYGYQSHRETYEYDNYDSYYNKSETKKWQGTAWISCVNDSKNRTLEEREKKWVGGKWIDDTLTKQAYSDDGKKILDERYEWNEKKNHWTGIRKDSTFYVEDKNLEGGIFFEWVDDSMTWIPSTKVESEKEDYRYSEEEYTNPFYQKEKRITYNWIDNNWQPIRQVIDNKGRNSFYSYAIWDEKKQEWRVERKDISETSLDGISNKERYDWNDDLNKLEGIDNTSTISLKNYNKRIIYRAWDNGSQKWSDTLACNVIAYKDYETYIYELYDENTDCWQYQRKVDIFYTNKNQKEMTQRFWDKQRNDWVTDRNMKLFYKDDSSDYYRAEVYVNSPENGSPVPLYCIRKGSKETVYEKWDSKQEKWVNYFAEKSSGWSRDYYLWDDQLNKFVKKEYYEAMSKREPVIEEFNRIETPTSYYSVMNP